MHFELLFPSEYLKAVDLQGREVVVVIEKVYVDELRGTEGQKKKKLLIRFKGKDKKLVCNITNARAIAEAWGPEVNDWPGKPITLTSMKVEGFGKMVDAIRVRPERPQQRTAKNGNGNTRRAAPPPPAEDQAPPPPDDADGDEEPRGEAWEPGADG